MAGCRGYPGLDHPLQRYSRLSGVTSPLLPALEPQGASAGNTGPAATLLNRGSFIAWQAGSATDPTAFIFGIGLSRSLPGHCFRRVLWKSSRFRCRSLVAHLVYAHVEQPFHGRWSRFIRVGYWRRHWPPSSPLSSWRAGFSFRRTASRFPDLPTGRPAAAIGDFGPVADRLPPQFRTGRPTAMPLWAGGRRAYRGSCRGQPCSAMAGTCCPPPQHPSWDVVSWTKSSCPLADVEVWFWSRGKWPMTTCDAWRRQIMKS